MLPAALLDVDGTLVDSNYHHVIAWNTAFRDHGIVVPLWRLHRAIGMGGDRFVATVAGTEIEDAVGDSIRARHRGAFAERIGGVAPLPGAERLVTGLVTTGHRVVLCSSAESEDVETYLELLGLREIVAWTTAADVSATKPSPDLVRVALERAGGGAAVMVGDTVWDVAAASHVGIPTIGVLSGGVSAAELEEAGAVQVFDDAAELIDQLETTPLRPAAASANARR